MAEERKTSEGRTSRDQPVLLSDLPAILRTSESWVTDYMGRLSIQVITTTDGKPAISRADFQRVAYSDEARQAALDGLAWHARQREKDQATSEASRMSQQISEEVTRLRQHIANLETIHCSYQSSANVLRDESPVVAAYVIYAKVIRLLNMACLCLENHYWETWVLLRPIDEAIQLAEYFVLCSDTEKARSHLRVWFRENYSPSNSTVRKAVGQALDSILGEQTSPTTALMAELYQKKSKELHHTYNGMWEVHPVKIENGVPIFLGFDYSGCSYHRKVLELTQFFRSSVWTAVQGLLFCFQTRMPLEQEHVNQLLVLDQMFGQVDK